MNLARADRSLIAWMLYFSLLFSAFVCSIGHGQMAGLQLSGLGGLYCSAEGTAGPSLDPGFAVQPGGAGTLSCLLCGGLGLGLALLLCLFGLRRAHVPGLSREQCRQAPPRHHWPSANPRASPFLA